MNKTYRTSSLLWAGNNESFNTYMTLLEQTLLDAKGYVNRVNDDKVEEEKTNRLLSVVDGVGVVSIHGVLTNSDSWYNRYFGMVAYSEVIEAMYMAAADPAVKEILMDVSSPGGAVDGILDAVAAVDKANKVKPVTAFTSSIAASAAYWLISPTKKRYATATAVVGSIGVVAKHVEYSKMMLKEGITETLVRAGEFKQLQNSVEPLSKKALDDLQEKVAYTYGVMVTSIAQHLGVSDQMLRSQMAEGREFTGQQGVDAGLIHGVSNFEEVFSKIQTRINKNGGKDMSKKYNMAAAVAAAAAGVSLEASATETPEVPAVGAAAEVPETVKAPETPEAPAAGAAAAPAPVEAQADATVTLLKAQLKERDDELINAKVSLKTMETELAAMAALKAVVASSVNNMTVALGGAKDETLASKDAASLVALHDTMLAKTIDSFKTGGVAIHEDGDAPKQPTTSRFDQAIAGASKIN